MRSFEYLDQEITDPWMDPSDRFPLTMEEAIECYGEENVRYYMEQTAQEMAEGFVKDMNPAGIEDDNANFAVYTIPIDDKHDIDLCFVEEDDCDGNQRFYTDILLTDKRGKPLYYTTADTMTNPDLIAGGIGYLLCKLNKEGKA